MPACDRLTLDVVAGVNGLECVMRAHVDGQSVSGTCVEVHDVIMTGGWVLIIIIVMPNCMTIIPWLQSHVLLVYIQLQSIAKSCA